MSLLTRLSGKTETSAEVLCPHYERAMDEGHKVEPCARKRMSRRFFFGVLGGAAAVAAMLAPVAGVDFANGPDWTAIEIHPVCEGLRGGRSIRLQLGS